MKEYLPYLNLGIQFFIALGTVGAVVTSLYFSSLRNRLCARGSANIALQMIDPKDSHQFIEKFSIKIFNKGVKPFKVNSFSITSKSCSNLVFFPDDTDIYSTRSDFEYAESCSGQYFYPKDHLEKAIKSFIKQHPNVKSKNLKKKMKFVVNTNIEEVIHLEIEEKLREYISSID